MRSVLALLFLRHEQPALRKTTRRATSASSSRPEPALPRTSWRASWRRGWATVSAKHSWSRTGRAPARCSGPMPWPRPIPTATTILMGTSTPLAINASLHKKLPYDPAKDFHAAGFDCHRAVRPVWSDNDLPARSCARIHRAGQVEARRILLRLDRAGLAVSTFMPTVQQHDRHPDGAYPLQGRVAAQVDLMGGRLQVMMTDFTSSLQLIREGRSARLASPPRIAPMSRPRLRRSRRARRARFEASAWQMVVAPAATPKPVVDKLHAELKAIMAMRKRAGHHPDRAGPGGNRLAGRSCRDTSVRRSSAGAMSSGDPARRWSSTPGGRRSSARPSVNRSTRPCVTSIRSVITFRKAYSS